MNAELFSVGLAHKVCLAAEAQGYTPELLNALAEKPDLFKQLLQVQLGHAEFRQIEHVINLDADPFVPSGLKVEEHRKGGQWKFDAAQIELYLADAQKKGSIEGNKLRKLLADKPVLNANVLDYLLTHTELIPENWKKDEKGNTRYIFFLGTRYRYSRGRLCVRCLCWRGDGWRWDYDWLGSDWSDHFPAALRAS